MSVATSVFRFKLLWRQLSKDLKNQHPMLNRGGCGVFAALAGLRLSRYMPVRLRVISGINADVSDARKHLKANSMDGWEDVGVHINHVALEVVIDGVILLVDSTWFTPCDHNRKILEGSLSINEGLELAHNPEGWNKDFPRESIPALEALLDKHLSEENLQSLCRVPWTKSLKLGFKGMLALFVRPSSGVAYEKNFSGYVR